MTENNKNTNKPQDNDPNSWKNREKGCAWCWPNDEAPEQLSIQLVNAKGETVRFVALKNKYKSDKKHPYWKIYTELPKDKFTPKKESVKKEVKKPEPVKETPEDNGDF